MSRTPTLFPVAQINPSFGANTSFEPDSSSEPDSSLQPTLDPFSNHSSRSISRSPSTISNPSLDPVPAHPRVAPFSSGSPSHRQCADEDLPAVDFPEWKSWLPSRRIGTIHRWIIHTAHLHGPMDHWAQRFDKEWATIEGENEEAVHCCLQAVRQRIRMGQCASGYLESMMECKLPPSPDDWHDLYVQGLQLSGQLCTAVAGVQYRLDCISQRAFSC